MHKNLVAALGVVALTTGGLAAAVPTADAGPSHEPSRAPSSHVSRLCSAKVTGNAVACDALQVVFSGKQPLDGPPASALTPKQLQDAYNLTGLKSKGRTVAIVDAFGYPKLERDLRIFRKYFNLPPCTTKNGCLTIMNQRGSTTHLPAFNLGWAGEQALDVDAVSSACPDCKIVVVQAAHSNLPALGKAVAMAAKQKGVVAISNSYSGHDALDKNWGQYYHQEGIAVTASTGDSGYTHAGYPASSSYVTAVGGTSLTKSAGKARGWSESAWSGAGSGCSRWNPAIKGSGPFDTGCKTKRAESDVSAAADPNRGGLAWYHPVSETQSAWGQVGGTSESSPIIASVYALSGNTKGLANQIPYANSKNLFDVTTGANGSGCKPSQICTARKGWDGPTGLGTPNGVNGF